MHLSPISVIITGTTGMVGEGVLHMCLTSPDVAKILIINRSPLDLTHPKLTQIIHKDFSDLSAITSQLVGYDGCFWCLGTTSLGKSKADYEYITYDLTLGAARTLAALNTDMTMCYISGQGTDRTQRSILHRARIKGKTEADLAPLFPGSSYSYRASYIHPIAGLTRALLIYRYVSWMYGLIRKRAPNHANTLEEVGNSMIAVTLYGYRQDSLEPKDIRESAKMIE